MLHEDIVGESDNTKCYMKSLTVNDNDWGLRLAVGDYDTCHIKTLTGSQYCHLKILKVNEFLKCVTKIRWCIVKKY